MKETTTLEGQKVSKNSQLIHFIGTVDELNSHLGLIKAMLPNEDTQKFIERIQRTLMAIMSNASGAGKEIHSFNEAELLALEKEIIMLSEKLTKQSQFVLPGKSITEAHIHIARTVARRTERLFTALAGELCSNTGIYLNRLSDYLFVLSRQF
jgi:cob(I)alamin adenosyltransferase